MDLSQVVEIKSVCSSFGLDEGIVDQLLAIHSRAAAQSSGEDREVYCYSSREAEHNVKEGFVLFVSENRIGLRAPAILPILVAFGYKIPAQFQGSLFSEERPNPEELEGAAELSDKRTVLNRNYQHFLRGGQADQYKYLLSLDELQANLEEIAALNEVKEDGFEEARDTVLKLKEAYDRVKQHIYVLQGPRKVEALVR